VVYEISKSEAGTGKHMRILNTQKPLQIYNSYDQMEVKIQKSHREALT
jgi:hypothetical protein